MTGLGTLCPRSRVEQVEALKKAAEEKAAAQQEASAVSEIGEDTCIEMVEIESSATDGVFPHEQIPESDEPRMDESPIPPEQLAKRSIEAPVSKEQVTEVDGTQSGEQWTLVKRLRVLQKEVAAGENRPGDASVKKPSKSLTKQLKVKKTSTKLVPRVDGSGLFKMQAKMTRARVIERQKKLGESSQKVAESNTLVTDL